MASPTIVRIDGIPTSLQPGQYCDLTIVATDPDAQTTELRVKVVDEGGNESEWTPVAIPVTDALEAIGEKVAGNGTLTQTAALTFRFTA
jgi:hypothetical protein